MEWIPLSISAISLLFVILTFVRTGTKDKLSAQKYETSQLELIKEGLLKANLKLDQVCAVQNEIRNDVKNLDSQLREMDRRVTVVERDLKTAFTKIDELREERQ